MELTAEQQKVWDILSSTPVDVSIGPPHIAIVGSIMFDPNSEEFSVYDGTRWITVL